MCGNSFRCRSKCPFPPSFQIEFRALLDALRFEQFAVAFKLGDARASSPRMVRMRAYFIARRHELFCRKTMFASSVSNLWPVMSQTASVFQFDRQKIPGATIRVCGPDFDVSPHAEIAALEGDVVASYCKSTSATKIARAKAPAHAQRNHQGLIILLLADA